MRHVIYDSTDAFIVVFIEKNGLSFKKTEVYLSFIFQYVIMQAGLVMLAGTAGKMVVTSGITPVVKNTISIIGSLRSRTTHTMTLQEVIDKHDIPCTLQTIEATCIAMKCDREPLKTVSEHVVNAIADIHKLLTRIADVTASHEAGYISRWRVLVLDEEIKKLEQLMDVLQHRFKLLCDIRAVVE